MLVIMFCGHTGDLSGGDFIWNMTLELQLRQPSLVETALTFLQHMIHPYNDRPKG